MKHEANRLTNTHWCEIIAKLSKPNAPSKRVLERKYEVSEGAIQKGMETMRIDEEPPINDEIQPFKTFAECRSATDLKDLKALHKIVFDVDDQLLFSDVQTDVGQMYDEMWQSFETFKPNVNKINILFSMILFYFILLKCILKSQRGLTTPALGDLMFQEILVSDCT